MIGAVRALSKNNHNCAMLNTNKTKQKPYDDMYKNNQQCIQSYTRIRRNYRDFLLSPFISITILCLSFGLFDLQRSNCRLKFKCVSASCEFISKNGWRRNRQFFMTWCCCKDIPRKKASLSVNAFSFDHLNWTELSGKTIYNLDIL